MDNPWDPSPWISDPGAQSPVLPAESIPKPETEFEKIHFAGLGAEARLRDASPWGRTGDLESEDPWGGWGDGTPGKEEWKGAAVGSWEVGRGKEANATTAAAAAVATLPDPWTGEEMTALAIHGGGVEDDRNADLGINTDGERPATAGKGEDVALTSLSGVVDEGDEGACDDDGPRQGGCEEQEARSQEERGERCASPEREQSAREAGEAAQVEGNTQVSKVQELVNMYDGMARTNTGTLSVQIPLDEMSSGADPMVAAAEVEELDGDDGGGEEEGSGMHLGGLDIGINGELENLRRESNKDDDFSPTGSTSSSSSSSSSSSAAEAEDQETTVTCRRSSGSSSSSTAAAAITTKLPLPTALPYPIDLSNLDDLFPGTEPSLSSSFPPERISDTIINDTFTSVSQRKAWYRVSRPGSIRKHNFGDDDSYVRVTWHNSHIRKDVLTTVRRWLEQDSLGGRLLLGRRLGHHAGASMFNWDSDAPGVQIGELLSQKRARAVHARQASAAVQGTVKSPLAASFGWSSSVPASPVDTGGFFSSTAERLARPSRLMQTQESGLMQKELEVTTPPTAAPAAAPATIISDTAPQNSPSLPEEAPSVEVQDGQDEDGDEDEDDWGEMVSSPTADIPTSDMVPPFGMKATTSTQAVPSTVDILGAASSSAAPYADREEISTGAETPLASESAAADAGTRLSTRAVQPSSMQNSLSLVMPNPWDGLDSLGHTSASVVTGDEPTPRDHNSMDLAATMADDGSFASTRTRGVDLSPRAAKMANTPLSGVSDNISAPPALDGPFRPETMTVAPPSPSSMTAAKSVHPVLSTPADPEPKRLTAPIKTSFPTKTAATTAAAAAAAAAATSIMTAQGALPPAVEQHCIDETVEQVLRDLPDLSYMLR
ncbi:hypothetical protein E4U55_001277 [Claviceps digitariae]|nr:hypothetical protein E4U55_001277 [Claviceps digitariae]